MRQLRLDLRLSAVAIALACAAAIVGSGVVAGAADGASPVPSIAWARSLPIDSMSRGIGQIGGTEVRALASMDGTLYAAIGYWRDTRQSDPALPGPQVLALDSPAGSWRVDGQFDDRMGGGGNGGMHRYQAIGALQAVQFHSDRNGQELSPPRSVLLASVWDRQGGLRVFSKSGRAGTWVRADLVSNAPAHSQIRSFGFHRDAVTGVERAFAGTNPNGIISGAYDASGSGAIRWDAASEAGLPTLVRAQRIMSFAECDGKLYATVGWEIYERQDGSSPSWRRVYSFGENLPFNGSGGLRGLTTINDPAGRGQVLLVVAEGAQGQILRINPHEGFRAVAELNVNDALSKVWGTPVIAGIVAYNDMTVYPDPSNSCPSLLIGGFDAKTPYASNVIGANNKATGAYYLIRDCQGRYVSREIFDPKISPKPPLVATRAIILSPFASDPPGTIYAGGFDAGNTQPHNTAWLYRGVPSPR
jgi:poly(A) polymerase